MPPKASVIIPSTAATTSGLGDTSIVNIHLQLIIRGQLQEIVNHLLNNNRILKGHINGISAAKVKLLLIK